MELPSCQYDEARWKLLSLGAYSHSASEHGTLCFSIVGNHLTVVHDIHGQVEEFSSVSPVALLQLPLPVGLCREPWFFTASVLDFLNVEVGMGPVTREHLLSSILAARDSLVQDRGFYIAVELEVTTVSFEDENELQPHRPCRASEAARRRLESESFVPAAGDEGAGTCAICLEDLSRGRRNKRRLTRMPCTHVFHYRCISRWLDTSKSCPMCRRELED